MFFTKIDISKVILRVSLLCCLNCLWFASGFGQTGASDLAFTYRAIEEDHINHLYKGVLTWKVVDGYRVFISRQGMVSPVDSIEIELSAPTLFSLIAEKEADGTVIHKSLRIGAGGSKGNENEDCPKQSLYAGYTYDFEIELRGSYPDYLAQMRKALQTDYKTGFRHSHWEDDGTYLFETYCTEKKKPLKIFEYKRRIGAILLAHKIMNKRDTSGKTVRVTIESIIQYRPPASGIWRKETRQHFHNSMADSLQRFLETHYANSNGEK